MDDETGGFETKTMEKSVPKVEVGEVDSPKIEVVDARGEKADVVQEKEYKKRLENDKVEEKLIQFETFLGDYTKQKVSEGLKVNLVNGPIGSGEVVNAVLSVNLPNSSEILATENDPKAENFLKVLTDAGTTYKEIAMISASSTTLHEAEHMIIDSRPDSQLEKDFKGQNPDIKIDKEGHTLSLLDEGITYAFQLEKDSENELIQKLEGEKPQKDESITIEIRKQLGEKLRPKLKEYVDNKIQIDEEFLKFAGEEMKKMDIDKYVEVAESERKERLVWKEAEPVLNGWKNRLESYEEKHRTQISKSLEIIAHFFGKNAPEKTNVDLHYLAEKDSSKGENVSNLVENNLLFKKDTDVIYWLSEVTRLPSDGSEQIEEEERRQTVKVIHETIHQDFQGENEIFKDALEKANNDAEINELRGLLMPGQASYLEPEAELTAIYLEQYADKILKEEVSNTEESISQKTIEYRVNKNRFQEIFMAVVRADGAEKWKDGGPYRKTHNGWDNLFSESQKITVSATPEISKQSQLPHEPSIYELGAKINDFSLIETYVIEGKQLDVAFVKELYKVFLAQKSI